MRPGAGGPRPRCDSTRGIQRALPRYWSSRRRHTRGPRRGWTRTRSSLRCGRLPPPRRPPPVGAADQVEAPPSRSSSGTSSGTGRALGWRPRAGEASASAGVPFSAPRRRPSSSAAPRAGAGPRSPRSSAAASTRRGAWWHPRSRRGTREHPQDAEPPAVTARSAIGCPRRSAVAGKALKVAYADWLEPMLGTQTEPSTSFR